jgi:hypothetical protein
MLEDCLFDTRDENAPAGTAQQGKRIRFAERERPAELQVASLELPGPLPGSPD